MEDVKVAPVATEAPVGAPAPAPAPEPTATPPQEPTAAPVAADTPPVNTEPRYVLKVNEATGRRELVLENGEPQAAAEQVQQEPVSTGEQVQAQEPTVEQPTMQEQVQQAYDNVAPDTVPAYNLQEFSQALATNTIDERRVPEQFKDKYIEYTIRKAQQDYDAYVAEQAHQQDLIQQQLNQKPDPAKQQEFFAKLNEEAKAQALSDLGISEADYKAKEFEDEAMVERFEAAKEWHRSRLINELQARARSEETARSQQASILGQVRSYVQEQRAKEPHFDEIDRMMGTLYQELPYNKAMPIAEAIQAMRTNTLKPNQLAILQEYYEIGRQMFYAKRNGLTPNRPQTVAQPIRQQPPVVEQSGSGDTVVKQPSVTETDMRNAQSARERNNILYELLKNRMKR